MTVIGTVLFAIILFVTVLSVFFVGVGVLLCSFVVFEIFELLHFLLTLIGLYFNNTNINMLLRFTCFYWFVERCLCLITLHSVLWILILLLLLEKLLLFSECYLYYYCNFIFKLFYLIGCLVCGFCFFFVCFFWKTFIFGTMGKANFRNHFFFWFFFVCVMFSFVFFNR